MHPIMLPMGMLMRAPVGGAPAGGPFLYSRSGALGAGQYNPAGATYTFNNVDGNAVDAAAWLAYVGAGAGWTLHKTESDGVSSEQTAAITGISFGGSTFTVTISSSMSLGYTDKLFDFLAP